MHHRTRSLVAMAAALLAAQLGCAAVVGAGDVWGANHTYETPNSPSQPGEPVVSLTFDDGPHPAYTPQILEILRRYGVKATFFQLRAAPPSGTPTSSARSSPRATPSPTTPGAIPTCRA